MNTFFAPVDDFGVKALLPELQSFLGDIRFYLGLLLVAGPVLLLILGAVRLLAPAKEANHSVGFRTFFGMGSVRAWRFTQWLSGLVWAGLGLVLLVVAGIQCIAIGGKDLLDAAATVFIWLIVEGVCVLLGNLAVEAAAVIMFDVQGNRRGQAHKPVQTPRRPKPVVPDMPPVEQEDVLDFDALLDNDYPQK